MSKHIDKSVCFDGMNRLSGSDAKKSRRGLYGKTTIKKCTKCNLKLHDYCFSAFHGLTVWPPKYCIIVETLTLLLLYILLIFWLFTWGIDSGKVTFKKLLWRTLFETHEMFIILWVVIVIFAISAIITDQNFDWYREGSTKQDDYYIILMGTYQILTYAFLFDRHFGLSRVPDWFMDHFVLVLNMDRCMKKGSK